MLLTRSDVPHFRDLQLLQEVLVGAVPSLGRTVTLWYSHVEQSCKHIRLLVDAQPNPAGHMPHTLKGSAPRSGWPVH